MSPSVTPSSLPSSPLLPDFNQGGATLVRQAVSSLVKSPQVPFADLRARQNKDCLEYAEVPRETDVMAIPDIHGDIQALKKSLHAMELIGASGHWCGGNRVAVFLGDYIDRVSDNLAVLDYLLQIKNEADASGGRVELLVGNHETMLLGAIKNHSSYREHWLKQENGGKMTFEEIKKAYGLKDDSAVWEKLEELFMPQGKYHPFTRSMKLMTQVDDVLYVHAGIDDFWAQIIADEGVDGVNRQWEDAFSGLMSSRSTMAFSYITEPDGPLWIRYRRDIMHMSEDRVKAIAGYLKKRGINAIVIGHDVMDLGPEMDERFQKYGIKLIATDVGMSSAYNNVIAGIKIHKEGDIEGWAGYSTVLHNEKHSSKKAA